MIDEERLQTEIIAARLQGYDVLWIDIGTAESGSWFYDLPMWTYASGDLSSIARDYHGIPMYGTVDRPTRLRVEKVNETGMVTISL